MQLWQRVGQGFRAVRIVRAPLIISVCAALVLSAPEQTREIYRILAQDITEGTYTQSAFALVFGATAAVLIWLIARNVTLVHASAAVGSPEINSALLRWLPRICGALIPIGMGIGLWMASTDITLEGLSGRTLESDTPARANPGSDGGNRPAAPVCEHLAIWIGGGIAWSDLATLACPYRV